MRSVDQSEVSIETTFLTNPSSPCHQGQHGVGQRQVGDEHQGHSPSRTLKQIMLLQLNLIIHNIVDTTMGTREITFVYFR